MKTDYDLGECPTNEEWQTFFKVLRYTMKEDVAIWLEENNKSITQEEFDKLYERLYNCDRGEEQWELISYIYYDEIA